MSSKIKDRTPSSTRKLSLGESEVAFRIQPLPFSLAEGRTSSSI
jgi:hypothetical protein